MRTGSPRQADVKGRYREEHGWFTVGDSLPVSSMSVERAARQILAACRRGDAEVVLGLPFQVAALVHGVSPSLMCNIMALINRALPAPGGIGTAPVKARDTRAPLAPAWMTALSDRAAERNNERAPGERAEAGRMIAAAR